MKPKALIIGAGIGGLTAAIALRQIGYEPVVFERAPHYSPNGTTLVLWPNALRVLHALGVAGAIMELGVRNYKTNVFTAKGKPLYELPLDLEARYGYPVMTVLRADLQRVLLEQLGEGTVVWGTEFTGARQDERQVIAQFAGGSAEQGNILIGADGIHSRVRAMLTGIDPLRFCGFAAYRGMVEHSLSQRSHQAGLEMWGEGKRFGLFNTGGQGLYWFATMNCSASDSHAAPFAAPSEVKQHLLRQFAGWHPPVEQTIRQTDESQLLRHLIYDLPSLPFWSKGRITLLGDAAHAMTPNLGQGACQAIEDGMVLRDSLADDKNNPAAALKRYEAIRIPQVRKVVSLSYRMGRVTQWEHPWLCGLRNTAFTAVPGFMKIRQLEPIIR